MLRPLIIVIATGAALLGANAAQAGSTHWSVGVDGPGASVYVSDAARGLQLGVALYAGTPPVYPVPLYGAPAAAYVPTRAGDAVPALFYGERYGGRRDGDAARWERRREDAIAREDHARQERGARWARNDDRRDDRDGRHLRRD